MVVSSNPSDANEKKISALQLEGKVKNGANIVVNQ